MCVGLYLSHKMPVGTFEDVLKGKHDLLSIYCFFIILEMQKFSDVHLLYLNIKTV